MDFLKNLTINLKATGPAAIIATWILLITAVGLFGSGELANSAMSVLAVAGGMILIALAIRA